MEATSVPATKATNSTPMVSHVLVSPYLGSQPSKAFSSASLKTRSVHRLFGTTHIFWAHFGLPWSWWWMVLLKPLQKEHDGLFLPLQKNMLTFSYHCKIIHWLSLTITKETCWPSVWPAPIGWGFVASLVVNPIAALSNVTRLELNYHLEQCSHSSFRPSTVSSLPTPVWMSVCQSVCILQLDWLDWLEAWNITY